MAHRPASGTLMFEAHLSYRCDLSCTDCNRGLGLTKAMHTPDMTLDTYREWLEKIPDVLKRKRHLKIIFTGGEPTLVPNLEDYIKATLEVAPMAKFSIATNEHSEKAREKLAYLAKTYGMSNVGSAKPDGGPAYEFLKGMFIAPSDIGISRKEPCPWSVRCGISVDSKGMTSCAMGGAVDGILDLGQRTWNFMELTDERLMELCKHCGAWDVDPEAVNQAMVVEWRGHKVSRKWHEALLRLAKKGVR